MAIGLSRLPRNARIAACVFVWGTAVIAFWKFCVVGVDDEIRARRTRLEAVRSEAEKGAALYRRLPELRHQVADLERRLDLLAPGAPSSANAADILQSVGAIAAQSNLTIRRITQEPPKQTALYVELAFKLQAHGAYHDFAGFLDRVGSLDSVLTVGEVLIRPATDQELMASIAVECLAKAFVFTEVHRGTATPGLRADSRSTRTGSDYVHRADGRDPFVSLSPSNETTVASRPAGLAGLSIDDVVVNGILKARGAYLALLLAPDKRSYPVSQGARLFDGAVKAITLDGVVFSDPAGLRPDTRRREIVKRLRTEAGGRE